MNQINCLILDDDPAALDVLEHFIGKVFFLHLVRKCQHTIEAMQLLEEHKIDLLFLDISMPEIDGLQFLNSIKSKPAIIFTTGFRAYALDGYEHDIVDFLLKPFDFKRFLRAVNKANSLISKNIQLPAASQKPRQFIFVKADYKLVKINVDDILFVEGLKDYIKIYTRQKLVLTLMSMMAIEEKLPADEFFRLHRSYIISLSKIDSVSRHRVVIGEKFIPISVPYRDKFYQLIDRSV